MANTLAHRRPILAVLSFRWAVVPQGKNGWKLTSPEGQIFEVGSELDGLPTMTPEIKATLTKYAQAKTGMHPSITQPPKG